MRYVFLLAKPPVRASGQAILTYACIARSQGHAVEVYLVSDGVLWALGAKEGQLLRALLTYGAGVVARAEDLVARGLPAEKLLPGVEISRGFYARLLNAVMEGSDRVVCG